MEYILLSARKLIMDRRFIAEDDLLDIVEMCREMERSIHSILEGNEKNLAICALISATINTILSQCQTVDEAITYRNVFVRSFDRTISDNINNNS